MKESKKTRIIGKFTAWKRQHNKDVDCPQIDTSPIKTPATYFVDIGKLTLKFILEGKGPILAKTILLNNRVGGIILF